MEGGGGVVAVVQGLQDAGLAVTLLSKCRPYGRSVLADIVAPSAPSPALTTASQTVADTATETVARDRLHETIYRTSYQTALCQSSGFSTRTPQYSVQGYQHYRSSYTTRSHDEEAFIDSLRKYPISPVRSRSADLIERMLSHAHHKNGPKHSSDKALPSKEAPKYLHADEIPTRDTGMATNDLRPSFGFKRNIELVPAPTNNAKSRNDNQIGMYDYLKSNHKNKKLKGSEVRYLTNVKQCLKERIRELCNEEPATICPKIQSRYSHHRKQYHGTDPSQSQKCAECNIDLEQDSFQNEISPTTSRDRRESREHRSSFSFKPNKACYCGRRPCDCASQPSRSIPKQNFDDRKRCLSVCDYECNRIKDDTTTSQLTETVMNWLKELPVYANFSSRDAIKRDEIISTLIDTIAKLPKDNMYFEKVEDEIRKCLKVLPMWRPENREGQESLENQLADSLLQRIKGITSETNKIKDEISDWIDTISFTRDSIDKGKIVDELHEKLKPITQNQQLGGKDYKDALKSEIVKALNDLPIKYTGSKTAIINNIADKLVEKLHSLPLEPPSSPKSDIKNVVLDWIKSIPQISDSIKLNDVLINNLITKLNNLGTVDTNKEDLINDVIRNWVDTVEEQTKCRIDDRARSALTNQLIGKLINSHQIKQLRENSNINNVVQKWFDDISDTLGLNNINNQRDLAMLISKLQDLQTIENDENRQNTMRQEIQKWLQNLQKKGSRYVDSGTQENLVNKLLNMMQDVSSVQKSMSENGSIKQNIWEWLESLPNFKQDNYLQYRDMVMELSEKLQNIKDEKGELTENDLKDEVTNWFQKLYQKRGIEVDPRNRQKLVDKLLSSVSPAKRRKNWEKKNVQEILSKEVSGIFKDSAIALDENDKKQLKDQILKVINQHWNDIKSARTNKPVSKIINLLKQTTNLPEDHITNMTRKLIDKVKQAALVNLDSIQEGPLILDDNSKDKLKSKVEDILNKLPLKNKRQVIDEITNTLLNNYEIDKPDIFDDICDLLKKANINETEAREITKEIMAVSNQFRNEVINTMNRIPSYGSAESLRAQKQIFMQRLEREITDFMEKVLSDSSSFSKDTHTGGLFKTHSLDESIDYTKFKNLPGKTSSPTTSAGGRDRNIEAQYKNQIKELIKKWIANLGIDDIIDESFKDEMAQDIAADIIDRQRYLQLSKTKSASQDEIEHLRYQLFKWTSKLPNHIDLTNKTAEIKMLFNSLKALDIPNLIRDANADKGNISNQNTDEFIEEHLYGAISNWLNERTIQKPRSSDDRRVLNDLISELSKSLKNILSSNLHDSEVEKLCKDEISKYLKKLNQLVPSSEGRLEHRASELLNNLKSLGVFANALKQTQDAENGLKNQNAIKNAVKNWCQKLPLQKGKTHDDVKDKIENFAEAISQYLMLTDVDNINTFMDEILQNLKKLPLQFDKEDSKRLPEFTEKLIGTLKDVLNDSEKYYNIQDDSAIQKTAYKKAAEVMYDNIQNWCENLPLNLGIKGEDSEQLNVLKQNLAGKLLKKVGEINLDPEIFHDDYLYEDVLRDEIDKILHIMLPKTKEVEEQLPSLKENLMKDLLEIKNRVKNDMEGFAYKQKLRDAISKTLSSIGLQITEETPLEILKDNLADAFISLHYVADNEELRKKFRDKIFNEINKFCDDYLKRNPSTPLNAQQLNKELYNALQKVPVPNDEPMRREAEQIRVKDVVADWIKDLPLEESPSPVQMNKIISLLAKKLHEIEKEAEFNPDIDLDEAIKNEISKWLKKFKLKTQSNTEELTNKLIEKIKTTKHSRKLDDSTTRKSINYADLTTGLDESPLYPPSSLSPADRAHLQRIRDRTSRDGTSLKPDGKKDASVSPAPIATAIQTEEKQVPDMNSKISQNASIQTLTRIPEAPTSITPQVIVKEYYWDSNATPPMEHSGSILSYIEPTITPTSGGIQQKTIVTPQDIPRVTKGSQTSPLPASKSTITQETSLGQEAKSRKPSDGPGARTAAKSQQETSSERNIDAEPGHYKTDDYLGPNSRNRAEIKSCKPCRPCKPCQPCKPCPPCKPCHGRVVCPGEFTDSPEAESNKPSQRQISQLEHDATEEDRRNSDDLDYMSAPCLRRPVCRLPICQPPMREVECHARHKRKNQPCTCRSPILTKCTIRPRSPCRSHHSNKSCYVAKNHCPKCWDGFCPHPSYLYFRPD